jgi:hypothetical protein
MVTRTEKAGPARRVTARPSMLVRVSDAVVADRVVRWSAERHRRG